MNRQKITTIVLCALFAAITAVLSQIAIPMPSGVPVTLQWQAATPKMPITDLCNSPLRLLSLHGKSNRFNGRLCSARCGRRSRIQRLQGRNRFNSRSYGRIYNRLYRYGCYQRNSIQKYARKVPYTA